MRHHKLSLFLPTFGPNLTQHDESIIFSTICHTVLFSSIALDQFPLSEKSYLVQSEFVDFQSALLYLTSSLMLSVYSTIKVASDSPFHTLSFIKDPSPIIVFTSYQFPQLLLRQHLRRLYRLTPLAVPVRMTSFSLNVIKLLKYSISAGYQKSYPPSFLLVRVLLLTCVVNLDSSGRQHLRIDDPWSEWCTRITIFHSQVRTVMSSLRCSFSNRINRCDTVTLSNIKL